ncbi:Rad9-domain-containing protein [Lipomyces chichibuensis]|uniref:Rad9-domain-containing protein n=1 Tax=Lipomyces chichibuensis TaxID=1546026 RepID=UPI003342F7FC
MAQFSLAFSSGSKFRDWSRSIYALSRINGYITIAVYDNAVKLVAVGSGKTTFASIEFNQGFFDRFNFVGQASSRRDDSLGLSAVNLQEQARVSVELQTKFFVPIFRRHEKDSAVERCEISLDDAEILGTGESRLIINLHCHHGITKTYKLSYAKKMPFRVLDSVDDYPNSFHVKATVLKEFLDHTSIRAEQFSIKFRDDKVQLSSYTNGVSGAKKGDLLKQPLMTSITVPWEKFNDVIVEDDAESVFSMKELRVLVSLADSFRATIEAAFSGPTLPIGFRFGDDNITVKFMLFTGEASADSIRPSTNVQPAFSRRQLVLPPVVVSPPRPSPVRSVHYGNEDDIYGPMDNQESYVPPSIARDSQVVTTGRSMTASRQTSDRRTRTLSGSTAIESSSQVRSSPLEQSVNVEERYEHSTTAEDDSGQLLIPAPLPPPRLPVLDYRSPFVVRDKAVYEHVDDGNESDGSDVIVWNQTVNAPSLQRMLQDARQEREERERVSSAQRVRRSSRRPGENLVQPIHERVSEQDENRMDTEDRRRLTERDNLVKRMAVDPEADDGFEEVTFGLIPDREELDENMDDEAFLHTSDEETQRQRSGEDYDVDSDMPLFDQDAYTTTAIGPTPVSQAIPILQLD